MGRASRAVVGRRPRRGVRARSESPNDGPTAARQAAMWALAPWAVDGGLVGPDSSKTWIEARGLSTSSA